MPSRSHLVILLHGIGASGGQLMPLASAWRPDLPDVRFIAPDAPFHAQYGTGHQWFSVDGQELQPARIASVRKAFDTLIGEIVEREGFSDARDRVAFVGVSQGAIVALDAVASGRWRVGAVVSFAGLLPPVAIASGSKATPLMLIHGQDDRTIPPAASTVAAAQLRGAGFNVDLQLLPATGHTISDKGARLALEFLRTTLI